MKKFVLYFALFLFAMPIIAQQPLVKFYLQNGSSKEYNIEDIENISFIKSDLSYSMSVFRNGSTIKSNIDIRNIDSIILNATDFNVILEADNISYSLIEIDSIIFTFNDCQEIQIGSQVWMGCNLNVDSYRNGDPIPEVRDPTTWQNLTTGAWCYNDNDSVNGAIYGKLYNWYAVNDPRGLAPTGWHIPTNDEWKELDICLGMSQAEANKDGCWRGTDEGGKLKSTGTIEGGDGLWYSPNEGATNSSGFSALPGGYRWDFGTFGYIGMTGNWWSSTESVSSSACSKHLDSNYALIFRYFYIKVFGFSVRCIRD